ncbi:MAG: putative toxin-antitoxin system toxin component, PIN family [Bacteroidota bacterium]|nr:putative toxin-antitoxin system toxin component, PIN family [Bacteroidota bacterium]
MDALKIEIRNPKALQLIKECRISKLIRVSDEPVSALKTYLKKMRRNSSIVPGIDEITKIIEEVRAKCYAKNKSLKLIIDTNLWISFIISNKQKLFDSLLFGAKARMLFSTELIAEIQSTITKPKLKKHFGTNAL